MGRIARLSDGRMLQTWNPTFELVYWRVALLDGPTLARAPGIGAGRAVEGVWRRPSAVP
jgi:hypothetical protein